MALEQVDHEERALINRMLQLLKVTDGWMERELPTVQGGSSLAGDDAQSDPHQLSHAVIQSLGIAIDHLHALRMALTGGGPDRISLHTYAPFTLTRAALENASTALWMLTPPSRPERILRRLRHELAGVHNAESALAETGAPRDTNIQRRERRAFDVADRVGIDHSLLARKHKPDYKEIVKAAGLITDLHDQDTNYVYLLWRLCSAVAHGDTWILNFFDLEVMGPTTPGVSAVRITAPTPLLMAAIQAAMMVIDHARNLLTERATVHR